MAYCKKCGVELSEETNFCMSCGTPVTDNTVVPQGVQQTTQQPVGNVGEDLKGMASAFLGRSEDIVGNIIGSFSGDEVKKHGINNLAIRVSLIVTILSTFLFPYYSMSAFGEKETMRLIGGSKLLSIVVILLSIGALVLNSMKMKFPALIAQGATVLMSVITIIVCEAQLSGEEVSLLKAFGVKASHGLGFYLFLLATIALAVFTVLQFLKDKQGGNTQQGN